MVYEGKEKYIFVSYAHKDADRVLPIIDALSKDGYRVWFDSGIEAGTEWPEYIEDHLINSHVVLVFMSPATIDSRNCRNEINFALELKKEILVVYLEDTTLLKGMHLQLNSTQSLFRKHHKSDETFIRELLKARILKDCHSRSAASAPAPSPVSPAEPSSPAAPNTPAKKGKLPVFVMLGAILVALIVLICVIASGGKDNIEEPPAEEPTSASEPTDTPAQVEMSDNPFDFTVEIEGVVYKLPCRYEDLTAQGWTISSSGCNDSTLIRGGGYESYMMSNNGKKLGVMSYNTSGNAKAVKDCLVGGFNAEASFNTSFKLAQDISFTSTVDEVVAAYGQPNNQNIESEYTSLTYQHPNSYNSRVYFFIYTVDDMAKYSSISIQNRLEAENKETETSTQRPSYLDTYKAPAELGSNVTVPVVKVGGDLYQLPAPVSAFIANGWKIMEQPSFVMSGNSEYIRMERNGAELYLDIINFSEHQTTAENCAVCEINISAEDEIPVELPNGIVFGLKGNDIAALVTEDFDYNEYSTSNHWSYMEYSDIDLYIDIEIDAETNVVDGLSVSCQTWTYE